MSEQEVYCFHQVSLLITVYNRSNSLKRLLDSFMELKISFFEIVVSDDGSNLEHLNEIRQLRNTYGFKLITTLKNKGLGNNLNKGQDAVQGRYTLYIQEDFIPLAPFKDELKNSIDIMNTRKEVDIIHYYSYFPYPYAKPFLGNYFEKIFSLSLLKWNHLKFYVYSDHPHLRRSDIFEKFGRYNETLKPDRTEYSMSLSFIKNKAKALFYKPSNVLFDQRNSSIEPSTIYRKNWKQSKSRPILFIRRLYLIFRLFKNTIELLVYTKTYV